VYVRRRSSFAERPRVAKIADIIENVAADEQPASSTGIARLLLAGVQATITLSSMHRHDSQPFGETADRTNTPSSGGRHYGAQGF
jgi:hypothetical protein